MIVSLAHCRTGHFLDLVPDLLARRRIAELATAVKRQVRREVRPRRRKLRAGPVARAHPRALDVGKDGQVAGGPEPGQSGERARSRCVTLNRTLCASALCAIALSSGGGGGGNRDPCCVCARRGDDVRHGAHEVRHAVRHGDVSVRARRRHGLAYRRGRVGQGLRAPAGGSGGQRSRLRGLGDGGLGGGRGNLASSSLGSRDGSLGLGVFSRGEGD